jgi:glutamate transport system substrate-binding protein
VPRILRRVGFATALFAATALSACSESTSPPLPGGFLRSGAVIHTGVTTDHPGWSMLDSGTNQRGGFDIELADWLSSKLQIDQQYVDVTLEGRIRVLEEEKARMVVATFSITDDRRKRMDFAGPYMITYQGVMVREGDRRIQSYEDLVTKGRNVCVADGTTSHAQLAEKDRKGLTLTVLTALKDCAEQLSKGQVDAVSTDQLVLYGFANSELYPGLHVLPDLTFGSKEQYGIGLPDNDFADCEIVSKKLNEFLKEGDWAEFFARSFPGAAPAEHKPAQLDPCEKSTAPSATPQALTSTTVAPAAATG